MELVSNKWFLLPQGKTPVFRNHLQVSNYISFNILILVLATSDLSILLQLSTLFTCFNLNGWLMIPQRSRANIELNRHHEFLRRVYIWVIKQGNKFPFSTLTLLICLELHNDWRVDYSPMPGDNERIQETLFLYLLDK